MRAVVATDSHRLEVRDVADPVVRPGNILVRVTACGICGSDLHMMEEKILAVNIKGDSVFPFTWVTRVTP